MSEWFKNWMMTIICASLVAACLQAVVPKGGSGRVLRLVSGLVLMGAILHPLSGLKALSENIQAWISHSGWEEAGEETFAEERTLLKSIIEQRVGAYILDKAEEWGISCGVTVFCRYENGLYHPERAELSGALDQEQAERLCTFIVQELAIPVKYIDCTSEVE